MTTWKDLLDPKYKGKTALVDYAPVGVMDVAMALESRGDFKYADKGNMTKAEIDKTIKIMIDLKKGGHFRSFWSTFDQSVNLMASGEVVIQSMWSPAVTAVRSRGIDCYYVPLKEGYRGWFVGPGADGASQRAEARLRLRVHELVQFRLAGRLHRQAGLLFGGAGDGQEVPDARRNGTTGTTASPPRSTSRIPTAP